MSKTSAAGASGPHWFDAWTRDLARDVSAEDLQRLFTRDTREAYRFFARGLDEERLANEPIWRRVLLRVRQVFMAFTLKLSPARRSLYLMSVLVALIGVVKLYRNFGAVQVPFGTPFFSITMLAPQWADGTFALFVSIILINLLLLLEVADRLSLKGELEVARAAGAGLRCSRRSVPARPVVGTPGRGDLCRRDRPASRRAVPLGHAPPRPRGRAPRAHRRA